MEEQAKKVSLYLECSTTALGKKERMCGYVLEYITEKGPATLVNYREGCGTYNREFLLGLVEALERIKTPCELRIYGQNRFVLCMLRNRLADWAAEDFMSNGKPIVNREEWPYEYVRSGTDARIEIGTNTYYLYGASTEASQDALQGLTAAGAYADEAALFPQNFIDQMMGRCSVEGSKVWMNCNPENPHNYINEEFIRKAKEKRVYHLHFMMEDNLTLSQKKIEEYKRKWPHSSVFYKRFILGLWVAAEGLIYQQFADNVKDYLITSEWLEENPISYAVIGVDFGGTKSAHSFTLTGFTRGYKQVVVLDEYYCKKRINPKQLQEDFIDFVKRAQSRFKVYEAYCDSAEQTLIAGLEMACIDAHVSIEIKNAIKGPINDRIAFYNSLIAQHRWKIMKHCEHIKEAFENAVYDDTKKNEDVRLDDGLMNVDSLDSTEYSTESVQEDILYIAA